MSQSSNPLSAATPWNMVADGYAETTMLMLAQYAEEATIASRLKAGATILDAACGTGALALRLASEAGRVHGIDFSEAMLGNFRQSVERAGLKNIVIQHGDAKPGCLELTGSSNEFKNNWKEEWCLMR